MLNIIFIGSSPPLALSTLRAFITLNQSIVGIFTSDIQPSNAPELFPVHREHSETFDQQARLHNIPCIHLNAPLKNHYNQIKSFHAGLMITCCFSKKIPPSIFTLPTLGAVNIHPSLLPKFRGPDPIFWQYKLACKTWGITLHKISSQFDAGAILIQQGCYMPEGIHASQSLHLLAQAIPKLLTRRLAQLKAPAQSLKPQNKTLASTHPMPTKADYTLANSASTRDTFNFICAYATINTPIKYTVNKRVFWLIKCIAYNHVILYETKLNKNIITVPCADGQISAQYYFD
ncbi:MAG: formyltransferase family protein [Methylococcales bacterium]|jgi:methionyl-tRNA formyltransferase|nr:formyltransferase family protein [Methylococcales bacterium]